MEQPVGPAFIDVPAESRGNESSELVAGQSRVTSRGSRYANANWKSHKIIEVRDRLSG